MTVFVNTLHIMLCFALILIILLQPGKDGAAAFGGGGGGNQMYGPRGSGTILTRATTSVAALFMVTSITLAWFSNDKVSSGGGVEDALDQIQEDAVRRASSTRAQFDLQPKIEGPDGGVQLPPSQVVPTVEPDASGMDTPAPDTTGGEPAP
jgi:preprotein translocase subunit SecG